MMPTEVMAGTVAVSTYRCAQLHYFGNELSASHESEIVIRHAISLHPRSFALQRETCAEPGEREARGGVDEASSHRAKQLLSHRAREDYGGE